ncbi:MAG: hypothetical protein JWO03_2175 [Bacteroidetes bacterium]|nr:hypothetical protein [Bacteroidota bacterium]
MNFFKWIFLLLLISTCIMACKKKCLTCVNVCRQVYTYDTLIRKYDTLCSQDFTSQNVYIDSISARGGWIKLISNSDEFSGCDRPVGGAYCHE